MFNIVAAILFVSPSFLILANAYEEADRRITQMPREIGWPGAAWMLGSLVMAAWAIA